MRIRVTGRIALLLACAALPARAEDPACYTATGTGDIAELALTSEGEITIALAAAPFVPFDFFCNLDGKDEVSCQVDCDGGQLHMQRRPEGIALTFSHLRLESLRLESVTFGHAQWDADGMEVETKLLARPADPAQCRALATRHQPLELQPGDYYPAVARIEAALARGGWFAGAPDWRYDSQTAEAVSRFQTEMGVEAHGRADRDLLRLLGLTVSYGTGGC